MPNALHLIDLGFELTVRVFGNQNGDSLHKASCFDQKQPGPRQWQFAGKYFWGSSLRRDAFRVIIVFDACLAREGHQAAATAMNAHDAYISSIISAYMLMASSFT